MIVIWKKKGNHKNGIVNRSLYLLNKKKRLNVDIQIENYLYSIREELGQIFKLHQKIFIIANLRLPHYHFIFHRP